MYRVTTPIMPNGQMNSKSPRDSKSELTEFASAPWQEAGVQMLFLSLNAFSLSLSLSLSFPLSLSLSRARVADVSGNGGHGNDPRGVVEGQRLRTAHSNQPRRQRLGEPVHVQGAGRLALLRQDGAPERRQHVQGRGARAHILKRMLYTTFLL